MRAVPILLLVSLAVAGCDCDEGIQNVPPRLGLAEDGLDFGAVAVGERVEERIRIRADSVTGLELTAYVEEPGAFLLVEEAPSFIPGRGFVDLIVSFQPPGEDIFVGTLVVETNDPEPRGNRRILLSGQGLRPEIAVSPEQLSLEATACPATATLPRCRDSRLVVVSNVGEVALRVGPIELKPVEGASAPANLTLSRAHPVSVLPPGGSVEVRVNWGPAPTQLGDFQAVLAIPSNDYENPLVEVPISARAQPNLPPEACLQLDRVTRREFQGRGLPLAVRTVEEEEYLVPEDPTRFRIEPFMNAEFSSCSVDPEGDALTYQWTVTRPEESRSSMENPSTSQNAIEPDVGGEYLVTLTVRDGLQEDSASVVLDVAPPLGLVVQLSWQEEDGRNVDGDLIDLDLHLIRDPDGALFCEQDCFWANFAPEWEVDGAVSMRPRLIRDDQGTGERVERIVLPWVAPGSRFRVAVHYYQGPGGGREVWPRIDLSVEGDLADSIRTTSAMSASGEAWYAAEIVYAANGEPTVTPILPEEREADQTFPGQVGGCF